MNKKVHKRRKLRVLRDNLASAEDGSFSEEDFFDTVEREENAHHKGKSPGLEDESFGDSPKPNEDAPPDKNRLLRGDLFSTREIDTNSKTYSALYRRHLINVECEDMTEKYLSHDIYTMMYLCKNRSQVMLFCLLVVAFQFAIILLVIVNATNEGTDNFFGAPVNVDTTVRVCQFCAILLMVASQDNFVNALAYFHDGYSKDILKKAPHATYIKFLACGLLKLVEGCLCLVMTFILIIQSHQVLGLFLNFAALSFIFTIDDVFFSLAGNFFFSDELSILVNQIGNIKVPLPHRIPSVENAVSSYRYINISYVFLVAVSAWVVIMTQQLEGRFVSQSISVQFGDRSFYELGSLSGAYDRVKYLGEPKNSVNNRFVYVRRDTRDAMFAYCASDGIWTFTSVITYDLSVEQDSFLQLDPCEDKLALTSKTKTYDILDTANEWKIINTVTLETSIDYFAMKRTDCSNCSNHGKCTDNKCECNFGSYGLNCEFSGQVCTEFYESKKKEPTVASVNKSFELFEDLSLHDRPVFYRSFSNENIFEALDVIEIIVFLGRRWVLHRAPKIVDSTLIIQITNVVTNFLVSRSPEVLYFSESVSVGTSLDTGTPIELIWYEAQITRGIYEPDEDSPVNIEFLCTRCNYITNPCHNRGICTSGETYEFGECKCLPEFVGNLCEAPK